jgi:endonuclease/exonuclease/phosphatase family metal-dependent hydrolase
MPLRVLTWNLFHGRDSPPDPSLFTWRSRLLRVTERNATHAQVNRELLDEFATVLCDTEWDVALLQECPPRWTAALAVACSAEAHSVLTSRNRLAALRGAIARLNPDLVASNEGGSNLTLVRPSAGAIAEQRELELTPSPERRAMAFTRIRLDDGDLCVANLHASAGRKLRASAEREVLLAAERASEWAGDLPLVLGGDLNLRPAETTAFEQLERRFGLAGPTGPGVLDHLLHRGLVPTAPALQWPPERREVPEGDVAIRLSDHAPVEATFDRNPAPTVG